MVCTVNTEPSLRNPRRCHCRHGPSRTGRQVVRRQTAVLPSLPPLAGSRSRRRSRFCLGPSSRIAGRPARSSSPAGGQRCGTRRGRGSRTRAATTRPGSVSSRRQTCRARPPNEHPSHAPRHRSSSLQIRWQRTRNPGSVVRAPRSSSCRRAQLIRPRVTSAFYE